MADNISIHIDGLDKLQSALGRVNGELVSTLAAAGDESAKTVLNTVGLRRYPPAGPGNSPPTPYYIRGRGMQYLNGNRNNSQRLGTQFYVSSTGYKTTIGNRATYARYVVGDRQRDNMKRIGWRKLGDVAVEKVGEITAIYQAWINRLLKRVGL